jgi:hypothetical protein
MSLSLGQSVANALGVAAVTATAGPLAAGESANGQACAWTAPTAVCASFSAVGVDPANWRLAVVSGAGQAVPPAGTFAPLTLLVTDATGNPVAGAPVAIHQTVTAAGAPCPAHGACPIEPVYAETQTATVSDTNGSFSVTPMQVAGVAEATNIAVATGTQGFVSLSIVQGP